MAINGDDDDKQKPVIPRRALIPSDAIPHRELIPAPPYKDFPEPSSWRKKIAAGALALGVGGGGIAVYNARNAAPPPEDAPPAHTVKDKAPRLKQDLDAQFGKGTWAKYGRFVEEVQSILPGVSIRVEAQRATTGRELSIVIPVGNAEVADHAVDELVNIRTEANMPKDALPFGVFNNDIFIPLREVSERANREGASPFELMSHAQKAAFRNTVENARKQAEERNRFSSFAQELSGDFNFKAEDGKPAIDNSTYETNPLVISLQKGNFQLPENIKQAGLRYAEQVQAYLDKQGQGIDVRRVHELRFLSKIVPENKPVPKEIVASAVLAMAMGMPRDTRAGIVLDFDGKLTLSELRSQHDNRFFDGRALVIHEALTRAIASQTYQVPEIESATKAEGNPRSFVDIIKNNTPPSGIRR